MLLYFKHLTVIFNFNKGISMSIKKTILVLSVIFAVSGCTTVKEKSMNVTENVSVSKGAEVSLDKGKRYVVKVDSLYQKDGLYYVNVEMKNGSKTSVTVSERDYNTLEREMSYTKTTIIKMYKLNESENVVKISVIH